VVDRVRWSNTAGRRGAWGVGVSALRADSPQKNNGRWNAADGYHKTKEREKKQTAKGGIWSLFGDSRRQRGMSGRLMVVERRERGEGRARREREEAKR
jgi:hypothetical protein